MTEENRTHLKYGGIAGGVLYVGNLILKKIGLIKSDEDKKAEKDASELDKLASGNAGKINKQNPFLSFNPNYWLTIFAQIKKDRKVSSFNSVQMNLLLNPNLSNGKGYNQNLGRLIDIVGGAKKTWYLPDTEEDVFGAFRQMKSQLQISKFSAEYFNFFKSDVLGYLKTFMNDEQLQKIYNIVKSKPLY